MSTNPKAEPRSNAIKDPDDWTTGDETMTGAQASYLKTLCEEADEPFDDSLTKAEASKRIDALQEITGRGREQRRPQKAGSGEESLENAAKTREGAKRGLDQAEAGNRRGVEKLDEAEQSNPAEAEAVEQEASDGPPGRGLTR
jgi:hypothetical protein